MPNTGSPRSNTPGSSCGAPSAYTLDGPPDNTIACGSLALISSIDAVWGTTSEYTRASRTRRAISCAYCAPKSTTRTGRGAAGCTCSVYGRGSPPPCRAPPEDVHWALQQVGDRLEARVVQHTGQHAAVDLDRGAVDEVGGAAAQEHADAAHFGGFSGAAQRNVAEVRLSVRIVFRKHDGAEVVGHRRSEGQAVDAGMRPPLLGQRPGEMVEPRLRRAVGHQRG